MLRREHEELRNRGDCPTLFVTAQQSRASPGLGLRCVRRSSAGPRAEPKATDGRGRRFVPSFPRESRPPGPAAETSGPGSIGVDVSRAGGTRFSGRVRRSTGRPFTGRQRSSPAQVMVPPPLPARHDPSLGPGGGACCRTSVCRPAWPSYAASEQPSPRGKRVGVVRFEPSVPSGGGSRSGRRHARPAPISSRRASRSGGNARVAA